MTAISTLDGRAIDDDRAGFSRARWAAAKPRMWGVGLAAAAAWIIVGTIALFWRETIPLPYGEALATLCGLIALLLIATTFFGDGFGAFGRKARDAGPWALALALFVAAWEIVTAKTGYLPLPFFPSPQALLEVYAEDWPRLLDSVRASGWLLVRGFAFGATAGFAIGLAMGWWKRAGYWIHPALRLIGPVPATAWLPIIFFVFPSSASASVFVIALASSFPIAVLTWSGIAGVNRDYYDIARTLGATERFLIFKVAIPAALPHVFVGLFMGLGSSFAVLVVAEMLGVKSGLGWYLSWAQGWGAYGNLYAALLVMALACSTLITILFRLRDRLLSWQKGMVRW
ncbi:ABC transporter permease [Terrarubrum flagellatum]|uniref:ABC transporter permease n=1 Tax=Terrirubrum flagellatum TaxID=2895980 RepID=UPI003145358C